MNGLRQFFVGILAAAGSGLLILAVLSTATIESTLAMLPSATTLPVTPETATALPAVSEPSTATVLPPTPTPCPIPPGWTAYTVLGGDTLEALAKIAGISAEEIYRGNCLSSPSLPAGSTINLPLRNTPTVTPVLPTDLPTAAPTATGTMVPTNTVFVCSPPRGWVLYTIQRGETLSSLARAFGTTVAAIRQANCLVGDTIFAGDRLYLPNVPTRTPTAPPPTNTLEPTATEEPTETPTEETVIPEATTAVPTLAEETVEPSATTETPVELVVTEQSPGTTETLPTSP